MELAKAWVVAAFSSLLLGGVIWPAPSYGGATFSFGCCFPPLPFRVASSLLLGAFPSPLVEFLLFREGRELGKQHYTRNGRRSITRQREDGSTSTPEKEEGQAAPSSSTPPTKDGRTAPPKRSEREKAAAPTRGGW